MRDGPVPEEAPTSQNRQRAKLSRYLPLQPPRVSVHQHHHLSPHFCFFFFLLGSTGILASRNRERSRSKSRTRSKSKSQSRSKSPKKQKQPRPVFAHFVIPLAGLLSAVTARFYDIGKTTGEIMDDPERAPLLDSQKGGNCGTEASSKKATKRAIRNAIAYYMSLLILAIVIVLCVFFASK